MALPMVSVLIPTFNRGEILTETLKSVVAQTFTDYEIILVDDGGTDDTAQRVGAMQIPNLRYVRQENGGEGAARNRGLLEARGKYVATLDDDDLWLPRKLELQVGFYEQNPECSMVTVPWAYLDDPKWIQYDSKPLVDGRGMLIRPFFQMATGHTVLIPSTIMFDRVKAGKLQFETNRIAAADTLFEAAILEFGPVGMASHEPLMLYRTHSGNKSKQLNSWRENVRCLRRSMRAGAFDGLTKSDKKDVEIYLARLGRCTIELYMREGRRFGAWRMYLSEAPHQIAAGRYKAVAGFPIMAFMPYSVIRKRWLGEGPKVTAAG